MRIYSSKRLVSLGSLILLAVIGSGCQLFSGVLPKVKSESSVPDSQQPSPTMPSIPTVGEGDKDHPSQWLLKPGLFEIEQGIWLGWVGLAFGLAGTGLSIHYSRNSSRLNRELNAKQKQISLLDDKINNAYAAINQLSKLAKDNSSKLSQLNLSCQQLEEEYASVQISLNSQRLQQRPEQDPLSFRLTTTVDNPPVPSQTYIKSPQQKLSEITDAVNRGDRQVVRAEMRAQLNITNESENSISMGRLNETQLEEVTAGGSYWSASFGGETWLYPTEQTLKGYSQSQRPTGIFNYSRQPIPSAQVVLPARLTLNGTLWQVVEMGSIAVPG